MNMAGPTAMIDRRILSRSRAGSVLLVAIVALAAGVTMAFAAGGRRASTSYSRFVEWSGGQDVITGGWNYDAMPEGADYSALADSYMTQLANSPLVAASQRYVGVGGGVVFPDGRLVPPGVFNPTVVEVDGPASGRARVLSGRLPDPARSDEVAVGFVVAERYDLEPGSQLQILLDGTRESAVPLTVVGVIAHSGGFPSLAGRPDSSAFLTPAFLAEHPEQLDWTNGGLLLRLTPGTGDIDDFRAAVQAAGIPIGDADDASGQVRAVNRLMRVQAGVLWLIAAVIAAASLMVIVQLVRRDATRCAPDLHALRLLGLRRREISRAGVRRGARLGAVAAFGAVTGAIVLSPAFPLGVARTADPEPGLHADLTVLIPGALLIVAVLAAVGGVAASMTARPMPRRSPAPKSALAGLARGLPPAPATGVRLALQPAANGVASTVRLGLVGLVALLGLLIGAASLRGSFDRLLDDPALAGATWDAVLSWDDPAEAQAAGRALATDPAVDGFALGGWDQLVINGTPVYTMFVEPGAGVAVATDRGRSPIGPDEVALGEAELVALGVAVGDQVTVTAGPGAAGGAMTATVVGRSILASPVYQVLAPGRGGAATLELRRRVAGGTPSSYFVRFRSGDAQVDGQALADRLGSNFWFPRGDLAGIDSLRGLRSLPSALMALLIAFAAVVLLHRLVTTMIARRKDVAVLRSLGLSGAQVVAAGATQGGLTSTMALIGAVPVGLLVASAGWNWVAHYLGVVPRLVIPVSEIAGVAAATIALGIAAGLTVAAQARRRSPGRVLRSE